ncbi:ABC1 kinase family protein [Luteimonas vadosa]|uniref:AarF/UbiB family protein n=1 Tax=Luteimonas vadosa TaxID=1165507 RepID=A0ABP9E3V6_9GAMM
MNAPDGKSRTTQILGFLLKYRNAGIFSGMDVDAAALDEDIDASGLEGSPEAFVDDLEALGPTFIKLGQALSTRPDMVPGPYLIALERMQDDVDPMPFDDVRATIEDGLGVRLNKLFLAFDETPLGSASLAQVHRATLRDGREVAVKVQRPDIVDQIHGDLDALSGLAQKVDRMTDIGRRVRFADWVNEFRKTLLAELDYRTEAENLERFSAHFEDYPELFVPQPLWDLTCKTVLTMGLVHGVKATDITGLQRTERSLGPLASALMRGYLDQVFVHGEIHADPHPGNLLVTEDDRIGLLDLGMVAHVPPKQRERLLKLLFAAVDGRGEEVAAEAVAMGTRLDDFDQERYYRDTGQMVSRYAARSGARSQSEGRLMLELVRLATSCGLRTPPEMSLLGKTLLNLEAVANALDPELDVKQVIEEHLDQVMRLRLRKSFSPAHMATDLMEIQSLLREAPRKLADLLSLLADNRLQVRVTGLEESRLLENMQKIANRISAGIISAAFIVAAAMMMDSANAPRLFGHPAVALVLLLIGAALGIAIVVSALLGDRRAKRHEEPGPR